MTVEHQRIMKNYEKREQMREEYEQDRMKKSTLTIGSKENFSKEDPINKPRHLTNCPSFQECAVDYKCRNYDPKYMDCLKCVLHETKGICFKKELHTDKNLSMLMSRETIDLDAKQVF